MTGEAWELNIRPLMLAAIGFFVYIAAEGEYFAVRIQEGDVGINDRRRFFNQNRPHERLVEISPPPYCDGPDDAVEVKVNKKQV